MRNFKSIKTKLMILIGVLVFVCFAGAITFISIKSSNDAKESAFETARQIAKNHGNEVRADLEVAMNTARTLSKTFEGMKNVSNTDRKAVNNILKTNLENNKNFIATWAIWDVNTFDNKDKLFVNKKSKDKTGRFIPYWYTNGNVICEDAVDINNYYSMMPKVLNEESIANPYKYKIDGKEELVTSVVVPITYKGNYVGVVGIDMVLSTIQKQLINIKPYKVGHVSLISNNGTYVSCENSAKLGMDIGNSEINNKQKIAIREGKPYEDTFQDTEINKEVFNNLTPIYVGNSKTPWSLGVYIPMGKIMENSREITLYSMIIATLSIILILSLLVVILTKLLRPIKNTTEMLKDIAEGEGDLTKRLQVTTNDEIGEMAKYFNIFVDKIQHLISQVKETIDSLAESSGEITSALSQTNKGIDEISCSLDKVSSSTQSNAGIVEETTASIHEFSQSIDVISEQANNTFENSKSILQSANIGTKNIIEIVEANNSVKESSTEILTSVLELKNSSDRVEEIVTMITTISEQTNLLALNAAIESARAGEHGKGFSVVAEEVRKLAEQSKMSASQISILLNEIKSKADATNNAVIEGQRLSEVSVEKSNVVREHFDSIFVSIKEMADKIKSISNRATEQSSISEEMTKSMNEISSVVQENATSVHSINGILEEQVTSFEEISANMEEFNKVSLKLKHMTDEFKI